jgi:lipid-A-disaccharide synthase
VEGRSHEVLAACDLTLIASGTATLEAALFKRPMVVAYKMHPLSWAMMKRMAYQPWVSLPNILARDFLGPELIQEACTAQALATEALAWLNDAQRRKQVQEQFHHIHCVLRRDTARCAADAIAKEIES